MKTHSEPDLDQMVRDNAGEFDRLAILTRKHQSDRIAILHIAIRENKAAALADVTYRTVATLTIGMPLYIDLHPRPRAGAAVLAATPFHHSL